jgi:hypothetical protein
MRKPKGIILYDLIFPLWMAMYFSPLILIPLIGNLVIDGAVISLALRKNGVRLERNTLWKWILSAWGLGFLADVIGTLLLISIYSVTAPKLHVFSSNLAYGGIGKDPLSTLVLLLVTAFCGWLIYRFNRRLGREAGVEEAVAHRVALAMGIITAPWLFLVPTEWFDALFQ